MVNPRIPFQYAPNRDPPIPVEGYCCVLARRNHSCIGAAASSTMSWALRRPCHSLARR